MVGDTVIFDANGLGRCNIDISIDVRAIIVQAGFTDSIVQQSGNTINIGPRRAIFNGGTFVGGDSRIRFEDPFIIDGATFISTTDTLLPTETVTLTSGSFAANNGTTVMRFSSTFSGDLSFHKLVFDPTGNRTYVITAGDTVDVQDSLIYTSSNRVRLNTGVLNVTGDIFLNNTATNCNGSTVLMISGASKQQITSSVPIGQSELPAFTIAKTADTTFFDGVISMEAGIWRYVSGDLNFSRDSGAVAFTTANTTLIGTHTIDDVILSYVNNGDFDLNPGDTLSVINQLSIIGSNDIDIDGTGAIKLFGDLRLENTNQTHNGSSTIIFSGAANQLISSNIGPGASELCNVVVDKSAGTLTVSDTISLYRGWKYVAGTTDFLTNSANVFCTYTNAYLTGDENFFNLTIDFVAGGDLDVNDSALVHGEFRVLGAQDTDIDGNGALKLLGDASFETRILGIME